VSKLLTALNLEECDTRDDDGSALAGSQKRQLMRCGNGEVFHIHLDLSLRRLWPSTLCGRGVEKPERNLCRNYIYTTLIHARKSVLNL
jgi:hypothetical protein